MGKWLDQLQQVAADYAQRPGSAGGDRSLAKMLLSAGAQGVADAVTLPRDVYEGRVDPRSDEGIERAFNMAGNIGLGARGLVAAAPAVAPEAGSIGMFIGRNAKNADLAALSKAEQLEAAGVPREQIWNETLWGRGADQEWRSEIDDSRAVIGDRALRDLQGTGTRGESRSIAPGFLWHQEHWRNYPEARKIGVEATYDATQGRMGGAFHAGDWQTAPRIEMNLNAIEGQSGPRSVMLHELMHDVQKREGFAKGGAPANMELAEPAARDWAKRAEIREFLDNGYRPEEIIAEYEGLGLGHETEDLRRLIPDHLPGGPLADVSLDDARRYAEHWQAQVRNPHDRYQRLAGEVEARNVQTRRDMSMDERRAKPFWETEDVPRERQIVRR